MEIIKVSNGYIIQDNYSEKEVYQTLDEVFERLLMHFEGRSETFGGNSFGKVRIERKEK